MSDHPFEMTLDLSVLNHLGINLYSNNPAVLAEAVANAWDADAEAVDIDIDTASGTVVIADNGHGMSAVDINTKFLRVGRSRREDEPLTPRHNRPVMGRKGIGKLSLFSMADTIEVQSVRNGERSGFIMSLPGIKAAIGDKGGGGTYYPPALPDEQVEVTSGTRITLRDLRKRLTNVETHLRRRIARRFSVIGNEHCFSVRVNGTEVGVRDRHYYPMLQFVWHYGAYGERCLHHCSKADQREKRKVDSFEGWIGTVRRPSQLLDNEDSLNRILVMARGKLVQEDILEGLDEAGIYSKYLIGEVQAEFLDKDDKDDMLTSNRQALVEDDPRFRALRREVVTELSYIREQWTKHRNAGGTKAALENEAIKAWFGELGSDDKNRARRIFGKINEMTVGHPDHRTVLFRYGVLAFETLKAKENLDALDRSTGDTIVEFGRVFGNQDELEATFYHQIVQGRIGVIRKLQAQVADEDALEKVIQGHLFDHLWLLDPSWERATATESMEQQVATEFKGIDAKLSEEERRGRVDIRYRTTAGKHILIELKRASVLTDTLSLLRQVRPYRSALRKLLVHAGHAHPNIDTVCVVGRNLRDWGEADGRRESQETMRPTGARVVTYQELLESAYRAYGEFLDRNRKAARIVQLLERVGDEGL